MAFVLAHLVLGAPGSNLAAHVNKKQDTICYQWFKQRLNTEHLQTGHAHCSAVTYQYAT